MEIGEQLMPPQSFCPLYAVKRLPQTVDDKKLGDAIARDFFLKEKFWKRGWHVYYVHVPDADPKAFLLLLPLTEVEQLLADVNQGCYSDRLVLGDDAEATGLVLDFDGVQNFTPRLLGQPNSRHDFDILRRYIPPPTFVPAEERHVEVQETSAEYILWKEKLQTSLLLSSGPTDAEKEAAKAERRKVQEEKRAKRKADLLRAEVYLGLRPSSDENLSKSSLNSQPLAQFDAQNIVPYGIDTSIVFICIDTELHESRHYLTEVGLSVLDTADVFDTPPGPHGQNWRLQIETRHIRVQEHLRHTNHRFLQGCPNRFDFGKSEIVPARRVSTVVGEVFSEALRHAPKRYGGHVLPIMQQRKCVIVGHAVKGDIDTLKKIGYDIHRLHGNSIIDTIDTAMIHQALHDAQQVTSLSKVLTEFDIEARNLHNAGNDAAYTLQAMLAIILCSAASRKADIPSLI